MSVSSCPGGVRRFLTAGILLLSGLTVLSGCKQASISPTPSATVGIDASLFPTPTVFSPAISASSAPLPSLDAPVQFSTSTQVNRQEDRIVLSFTVDGHDHLFAYLPLAQPFVQLTSGEFDDRDPAVSPDGTKIAFTSNRSSFWDLYMLDLASGDTTQLTKNPGYDGAPSWSPDGQWLTYETYNGSNFDIMVIPVLDQTISPVQLTQGAGNNFAPRWSPAGREIAFVSDRSGMNEIWLAKLDIVEGRFVKVIGAPGASYTSPAWSPDGSSLAWTKTVQGESTVETAPLAEIPGGIRTYGSGDHPIWSQDGSAILVQQQAANSSYLVSLRIDDGVLLFPAEYFPSRIHGTDWRTATLVNPLPSADPQPDRQPAFPLWQKASSPEAGIAGRQTLVPVNGLKAPYAYLHPAALTSFQNLHDESSRILGWDFMGTLNDAVLPISAPPQPGISENWLYTGRAINLNSAPLTAGWMTVTREDIGGKVYWRVWMRCYNQDGSCGEPIKEASWDFSARYQGDGTAYEEGGKTGSIPAGYWVDFTGLALSNGFERSAALNNWRNYFQGTLFNQFVFKQGLSWQEAMLQLYPLDQVTSLAADTPLPVQQ